MLMLLATTAKLRYRQHKLHRCLPQAVDTVNPTVSIADDQVGTASDSDNVVGYTVTFSESVTGFVEGDLSVSGGTVSNFAGSGTTYTFDVTADDDSTDNITVDIASGAAQDAAGNDSEAATQAVQAVDTENPTTTFNSAYYDADNDLLTLSGTNMLSLLSSGESSGTSGTDIANNLDWAKLIWDTGSTTVSFDGVDVAGAYVLDDYTLQIDLDTGNEIEGASGYGVSGGPDNIDITAGFSVDSAGNVATTDTLSNGVLIGDMNVDTPNFAHPYWFSSADTANVKDGLDGGDEGLTVADFDATRGDTLMFVGYTATQIDGGEVTGGNTELTIDGTTITLTGYTDDLDGTVVVFDDGSLLKTNTGGSESLYGGIKGDLLLAGNSGDTLVGYSGNDILLGGDGNDVIIAGSGLDTITGGDGSDYIVLGSDGHVDMLFYTDSTAGANDDDGADFVSGFMAGDGGDTIHIADLTQSQVDAAKAGWISQSGSDTLINLGEGETIRLLGVDSSTLTDFNLVGDMPDL